MRSFLVGFFSLALLGQTAFGAIVYQAGQSQAGTYNINGNALDYLGDTAYLAGTERYLTAIDIGTKYYGNTAASLGLTLELYADSNQDGLPDDVDPITAGNQYQVIGSSSITQAYSPFQDVTAIFPFNNLLVPNNIAFVVKQDTFDNNFALYLGNLATIGTSFGNPSGARAVASAQGNPNFGRINFGGIDITATIHANQVPEPGTMVLAGIGAVGLVLVARRRRA